MAEDSLPSRDQLLEKLRAYHAYMEIDDDVEAQVKKIINDLHDMVPHAAITDLIFWGERLRSDEEIVDEALCRERLWQVDGELALLLHIREQMEKGMADPAANRGHKSYAATTLVEVTAKIERLKSGQLH